MGEFDLIAHIQARVRQQAHNPGIDLGIGDDAAVLSPPPDARLVVTSDTLNAGVHFPHDTAAFDIGFKTLAVNLSDLAAMGAEPWTCTLNITLPALDRQWMDAWFDGFMAAADLGGITLVGGDTTSGPMAFTVTAFGLLPPVSGYAPAGLRRSNALVGDDVWVTGSLGEAALALRLGSQASAALRRRLDRPTPRLAMGAALRELPDMGACCDVSDGLLQDLGHIATASSVRIELDSFRIPLSAELQAQDDGLSLACTGGDDYELAFTCPSAQRSKVQALAEAAATPVTLIGRVHGGPPEVRLVNETGHDVTPTLAAGFDHFAERKL